MAGSKKALLIGINKYPKLASRYQLNGCVNDVGLIERTLKDRFGFTDEGVTLLREEKATRDSILASLDDLVREAGKDDIVVIYYSGHGSRRRNVNGIDTEDISETIVPSDSGRDPHPNRDISDDEIYARLLPLSEKTPSITLMFDSCHSGTISRDPFEAGSRWVEPDERPYSGPVSLTELGSAEVGARGESKEPGPSGWLPLGERYVLMAGCLDEESSYEHRIKSGDSTIYQGALTYFLAEELNKAISGTTYRDIFEPAGARVTSIFSRQHPQMEGARDREIFGTRSVEPMRFVPVTKRAGNSVSLGAGAAQGMTIGSRWAIYPQGTKEAGDEAAQLGSVEIIQVRALEADANIVEEKGANVMAQGCRAVETAHAFGEMRLVVGINWQAIHDAEVTSLKQGIEDSLLLRLTEEGETADVMIYLLDPRPQPEEEERVPVPRLGALQKATWAAIGSDGLLLMPAHMVSEAGVVRLMVENLEKVASYRQTLALKNPNSPLDGKVDFTLLRQGANGAWAPAEADAGGQVIYEDGERIAFEIRNRHTAPIYINILDFGLSKSIGLIYPVVAGANEQLPANKPPVQVGVRTGEEMTLFMPPNFPYAPYADSEEVTGGIEIYKLFASTRPADFSLFLQGGMRSLDGVDRRETEVSQFDLLLDLALNGFGSRETQTNTTTADAQWTTVERRFVLKRKGL